MTAPRKYIKTKFEGVFYRESTKRDPKTGEYDRVYCFWYSDAEGKGHWKTVGRHSKGIRPPFVRNERARFLAEMEAGHNPALNSKVTVGTVVDSYAAWSRNEGKYIDRSLSQYNLHMRSRLHMLPVSAVTPGMLSGIKAELESTPAMVPGKGGGKEKSAKRTLSAQTVSHLFAFLRAAVYHAMATELWKGQNPFAGRRGGPWKLPKVDNARLRFLSPDEADALLEALRIKSPDLRDMALLSLKTGLRATEIFKLRAQDVNTASGILHITGKGGLREQVHATQDVIGMLQERDRSGGEYLFSRQGDPDTPLPRISASFARTVKELGLDQTGGDSRYAITFHTFRHTFASWLAQSGKVSLLELKQLMRHESISMTQRYAHLIPGQERERLAIIDDMLKTVKRHD